MNFDILEVFTRAAKITWKYKVLWIFGILASCGRSSGGSSGGNSSNSGSGENPFSPQMSDQFENFLLRFVNWYQQNTWVLYAFIFLVFILIILQTFFTLVGTAGLARGVLHIENGVEIVRFGELFSESLKYFWRLFGASLLFALPFILIIFTFILIAVSAPPQSEATAAGFFLIIFAFLCCLLFPMLIFLGFFTPLMQRAILLEDLGVFAAIARAWKVMTKNILGLILAGIIMFIGNAIIGIIISLPALLVILPLLPSIIEGSITSWQPLILSGILLLCYSPIAWFFNGVLVTYTESVWTLIYLRVTKSKAENNAPILSEANA